MNKLIYLSIAAAAMSLTSCIEEVNPLSNTVTSEQAANAPGSFANFTDALVTPTIGQPYYGGTSNINSYPYDFGYPAFFLERDVMGQDIVITNSGSHLQAWAYCSVGLGPRYAIAQIPITCYYGWIKNCNNLLSLIPEGAELTEEQRHGAGQAYAMRALFYEDVARMYAPTTYGLDKQAPTAPIVTDQTTLGDGTDNPRATNEVMWDFIISDLDKAEELLADYRRENKYTPDLSVVYGLKARAYLVMEDWANAEKYAKLAQEGYTMLNEAEYTSRTTGFNTVNDSWMFAGTFKSDDPCILLNDADSSWGSLVALEITDKSRCGYAANYGYPLAIDYHLYSTIPASDFRRKCFVDFAVKDTYAESGGNFEPTTATVEFAAQYSDYAETLATTNIGTNETGYGIGGASLKFRAAGGEEGHNNQYIGFLMDVPYMRVEEMKLIEAEAAGMQNEGRGIQLLTEFAQTRDPEYVYGTHNEAYGNAQTSAFQNEVWWQRRVELWGEGQATFDIKRLNKGIIRSYEGTNHIDLYQWNTTTPPQWMTLCFVGTEANYNLGLVNNPTPVKPDGNSPKYVW